MQQKRDLPVNQEQQKETIERLVERVQAGEMSAFSALYEHYVEKVYRYFYFKTSQEEAFDLTENVFLRVWENIRQYQRKADSSFAAWLFRVAHNLLVDHYRVQKPNLELDERHPDQRLDNSPVLLAERSLSRRSLKVALGQLKENYREVLTLSFLNGLSNEEVARVLNKSKNTLRVLKFQTLRELKKILKKINIKYQ